MVGIVEHALVYRQISSHTQWTKYKLGDLGLFIRGLTYDSNSVVGDPAKTLVIRSNNLIEGENVNFSDVVYVDKLPTLEQKLIKGDVVFCMANGSSSLVGKNSYYDTQYNGIITVGAFCGIYRSKYRITRWALMTSAYKRAIYNLMQGGNGAIANLKGEDILNLPIYLPKSEMCDKLDTALSSLYSKTENEKTLLRYLQKQRQYLLQQMFI